MSDFASTVHVVEEFSSGIGESTKELLDATDAASVFKDAIVDTVGYMKDMSDRTMEAAIETGMELVPALQDTMQAARNVGAAFSEMVHNFSLGAIKDALFSIVGLLASVYESGKKMIKLGWEIGKLWFMWKNGLSMMQMRITSFLTHAMANAYKKSFHYVNKIVGESIEEIALEDKMVAMWGDAGRTANNRMYELANELGENAGTVMQAAAKAASNGIGTDDFEDIYRFADKIAKLNPGDTAADVANTLVQSIKSGHDAESITGLLGGGDLMTRELKRKGYERKLNHGDLQGALNIAKEVAEKAGYTQDKYEKAGNSLSNNFKYINNVVDNIKRRMHEIYAKTFAPVVEKIAKLMRSEDFKFFIQIMGKAVETFGKFVSGIIEALVDNWKIFVFFLTSMIAAKLLFFGKLLGVILKFRGAIGFVLKSVLSLAWKLKSIILSIAGINKEAITGGNSMWKQGAKFVAIAVAVLLIYKAWTWVNKEITDATGKSYTLKQVLAGLLKSAQNGFYNFMVRVNNWYMNMMGQFYRDRALAQAEESKEKLRAARETYKASAAGIKQLYAIKMGGMDQSSREYMELRAEMYGEIEKVRAGYEAVEKAEDAKMAFWNKAITNLNFQMMDEKDLTEGIEEAMETGGASIWEEMKKDVKTLLGIVDDVEGGVETSANALKKMNEQEEELRWLKAFSDRQIMSRYGDSTSNVYNRSVTFNGMSEASRNAHARAYAAFPSRASH